LDKLNPWCEAFANDGHWRQLKTPVSAATVFNKDVLAQAAFDYFEGEGTPVGTVENIRSHLEVKGKILGLSKYSGIIAIYNELMAAQGQEGREQKPAADLFADMGATDSESETPDEQPVDDNDVD